MGKIIYKKKVFVSVLLVSICIFTCCSCNVESGVASSESKSESNKVLTEESKETSAVNEKLWTVTVPEERAKGQASDAIISVGTDVAPEDFQSVHIDFKDHKDLSLDLVVPSNWKLVAEKRAEEGNFGSPIDIYIDEKNIGYIGNASFEEQYLDVSENQFQAVYNQLMVGSHVNWHNDYKEVHNTNTTHTATCMIYYSDKMTSTGQAVYNMGILSYDTQLLRYVGIELQNGSITEEQRLTIAESIRLSALEE